MLGHLSALEHLTKVEGCVAYNLGTGAGVSVLEIIRVCFGSPLTSYFI